MSSPPKGEVTAEQAAESAQQSRPPTARRKNIRPPLPDDFKELCALCRAGKLFAVQEWFKTHEYDEPEQYDCRHWPIGIAIEKGFHSLVEVLLQNGIPPDGRALQHAVSYRNKGIIELLLQHGADVNSIDFAQVVYVSDPMIVRLFIDRGADVLTDYPIARGLIHATRLFLGIYKSYIGKYPQLQFQADMALRHFCEKGNLRGVSLLMWLGANPRAKVPADADESEECWRTPLAAAASGGQLDIIKRLKPDPAKDDLNDLLREGLFRRNMDLVRYWISLGGDINHVDADRDTAHRHVFWSLTWAIDRRDYWYSSTHGADAKRFAQEWFSSGAKWQPKGDDFRTIRKAFSLLSYMEVYEFVKLFREKDVIPVETLGEILDTPKLKEHLKERRAALAALVPKLQKWITADERKRRLAQQQAAARNRPRPVAPRPDLPEPRVTLNDPRLVRRLSDE